MPRRVWTLRDIRGHEIPLVPPTYVVYSASGIGIAPAQHVATRNAYQDGETFEDGVYDGRTLQLGIDVFGDAVEDLPALKDALYQMLAPLWAGCYVHVAREDGSEREVMARLIDELSMAHQAGDGALRQRVVLTMRAAQPHWYDPVATLWVYDVGGATGSFGFPVGFPAGFGVSAIDVVETRVYPGHLDVEPEIRVTGPCDNLVIENQTLDTTIDLSAYSIAVGEVVTASLAGDRKTITSSVAGNILAYLSDDSDLGEWCIAAHPRAADGRNRIRVQLENATNATQVVIQFNPLYAGV